MIVMRAGGPAKVLISPTAATQEGAPSWRVRCARVGFRRPVPHGTSEAGAPLKRAFRLGGSQTRGYHSS